MTIITNRYTIGLMISALFAAMIYIGYMEFKPDDGLSYIETVAPVEEESEWIEMKDIDFVNLQEISNGKEFFAEYRLERDRTRSRQLDLLQQIVENPESVAETRQEAQQKILEITNYLDQELQLEHLIKAKGFDDAVVFIQPHSVTVVINQESFEDNEITKIADLVTTVTSQGLDNIYIIPKADN